jgi:hypothetical protein
MVGLVLVSSVLSLWLVRGDMRIFLRRQGSCRGHNNLSQSQGAGRDAAILVGRIAVTEVLGTGGASAARHGATVGSCPYVPLPTEAAASSPSLSDMFTCHWCNAPIWEATVDVGGSRSDEGRPRRRSGGKGPEETRHAMAVKPAKARTATAKASSVSISARSSRSSQLGKTNKIPLMPKSMAVSRSSWHCLPFGVGTTLCSDS